MKIAIAVSGGVDSLYALVSLKDAGHDVAALHARFLNVPKEKDPVPMLSALCKEWDIPLHVIDLKEDFSRNVIRPFLESYARSETPNPCAHCNKNIKFGRLLDIARNLSVESLATGHYVTMAPYFFGDAGTLSYGLCLKSAQDMSKDQSYFLALTPLEKLRFAQFPLADKIKKDIVEELRQRKIPIPIQKESQEVCFVPNDNYREFIEMEKEKRKIKYQGEGDIVFRDNTIEKEIAKHNGLWRYTEGQRKGLGIAWSEPLYVIEKNEENNTLYVGTRTSLDIISACASSLNFLVAPEYWNVGDSDLVIDNLSKIQEDTVLIEKHALLAQEECSTQREATFRNSQEYDSKKGENSPLFVRTRFREKPSPARVFLEIMTVENKIISIELATKESFAHLKKLKEVKIFPENSLHISNRLESENTYLWHVQEEDNRFESEAEKEFAQDRAFWHTLSEHAYIRLVVRFLSPKQVYAKGQVLAVYDKQGFLLAGGILE